MKIVKFSHNGSNVVLAYFKSNITKLLATESFETSFSRLGGIYMPDLSNTEFGSAWTFPNHISANTLDTIIFNTCFECGGLMKTLTREIEPKMKIRICTVCGHSHV